MTTAFQKPRVTPTLFATEQSTAKYEFDLVDEAGTAVPLSALTTLTAKLTNAGVVINSRDHQSIKNVNGGTYNTNGHGTLLLAPADNPILAVTDPDNEKHVLLLHATWGSGKELWWTVNVLVRNVAGVPVS